MNKHFLLKIKTDKRTERHFVTDAKFSTKQVDGREVQVVLCRRVNKFGDFIGKSDEDHIHIFVGPTSVEEVVFDFRFGELVAPEKATQNQ